MIVGTGGVVSVGSDNCLGVVDAANLALAICLSLYLVIEVNMFEETCAKRSRGDGELLKSYVFVSNSVEC
jgi:hypothetical protein